MAGDPLRSKRKVMTGVIFSASNCHNQRPHYFIRHFGSYHEEINMHENDTFDAGNCLQKVLTMDLFEYFAFIMVVLVWKEVSCATFLWHCLHTLKTECYLTKLQMSLDLYCSERRAKYWITYKRLSERDSMTVPCCFYFRFHFEPFYWCPRSLLARTTMFCCFFVVLVTCLQSPVEKVFFIKSHKSCYIH